MIDTEHFHAQHIYLFVKFAQSHRYWSVVYEAHSFVLDDLDPAVDVIMLCREPEGDTIGDFTVDHSLNEEFLLGW